MENMNKEEIKEYCIEFTEKEITELEAARKREITFDEECPETTPERARKFRRVNPPRLVVG